MKKFDKLVKSIRKGEIDKASQILQQATLNINQLDSKSGKSLLQITIQNNDTDMFNILLSYPGINIQQPSKQGQFPLQTAILLNNPYFVSKLLQTNHINPRTKNSLSQNSLMIAIKNQTSKQILYKLIQYKFDPYQHVELYGSMVNYAIINKKSQNLMFLLNMLRELKQNNKQKLENYKKILTQIDQDDNTCLIIAVQQNQAAAVSAILQYLSQQSCILNKLQKQFLINSQNKQGNTALHIASIKNYQTMMGLLQKYGKQLGYDFNIKNKKGHTIQMIKQSTLRQLQKSKQQQKKNIQQKKIYLKQKQIQKQRQRQQEERRKVQEKKRKKEEEMLMEKQIVYENQVKKKKTLWGCGIFVVIMLGAMYLFLLNTVNQKKLGQM